MPPRLISKSHISRRVYTNLLVFYAHHNCLLLYITLLSSSESVGRGCKVAPIYRLHCHHRCLCGVDCVKNRTTYIGLYLLLLLRSTVGHFPCLMPTPARLLGTSFQITVALGTRITVSTALHHVPKPGGAYLSPMSSLQQTDKCSLFCLDRIGAVSVRAQMMNGTGDTLAFAS